jgi:hypothetical protein
MAVHQQIVSAVFDTEAAAEGAVAELRRRGVPDESISVVAQGESKSFAPHDGKHSRKHKDHDHDHVEKPRHHGDGNVSGMAKGLSIGAGTGALFGLAALAIPGVGPFVTAGFLANALGIVGGTAAAGAIVGGTAGGLTSMLTDYGVGKEQAVHVEQRIREGGVFVAVAVGASEAAEAAAAETFRAHGGHVSGPVGHA